MSSAKPISSVYENDQLRPLQPLPLRDHQRVKIIVLPDEPRAQPDPERVRQLHEQADAWLAQQPPHAAREPKLLSPEEKDRLDAEFDQLLAEIHNKSTGYSEEEPVALVDEAVAAARAGELDPTLPTILSV